MKATRILAALTTVAALIMAPVFPAEAGNVNVSYLFKLSDFHGVIPYASPKLVVDNSKHEVYVITLEGVSIFNRWGMEVYHAEADPETGFMQDLAIDEDGNIYTLVEKAGKTVVSLCNYRLEPQKTLELHNVPAGFIPNRMFYRNGRLYLASSLGMKIVLIDLKGNFVKQYDLVAMSREEIAKRDDGKKKEEKAKEVDAFEENGLEGFSVDRDGNMLFVLPVTGKAARLSPEGVITQFGKRGSGPGKLGVPSAIVGDKDGNYLVCDKLRGRVLIYGKDLGFIKEFNYLGGRDSRLVTPSVMAMSDDGELYVGQAPRRGVNVFRVVSEN
jgi:sugar lactone lactonase YvrE